MSRQLWAIALVLSAVSVTGCNLLSSPTGQIAAPPSSSLMTYPGITAPLPLGASDVKAGNPEAQVQGNWIFKAGTETHSVNLTSQNKVGNDVVLTGTVSGHPVTGVWRNGILILQWLGVASDGSVYTYILYGGVTASQLQGVLGKIKGTNALTSGQTTTAGKVDTVQVTGSFINTATPSPSISPLPASTTTPSPYPSINPSPAPTTAPLPTTSSAPIVVSKPTDLEAMPLERNMARLPGVVINVSSEYSQAWNKGRLNDGLLNTSWFSAVGDAANLGKAPYVEYVFPKAVTVKGVNIRANREYASGYDVFEGILTFSGPSGPLFSQVVALPQPDRDFNLTLPTAINGVTTLRFTLTKDESTEPGLAEIEVEGSAP